MRDDLVARANASPAYQIGQNTFFIRLVFNRPDDDCVLRLHFAGGLW